MLVNVLRMKTLPFARVAVAAVLILSFGILTTGNDVRAQTPLPPFEEPPDLDAVDVAPAGLLVSSYHQVQRDIDILDGLARFQVDSDFGHFPVTSVALLHERVHEIETLGQGVVRLREVDQKTFKELPPQLQVLGDSVPAIVSQPLATTSRLAGQFGNRLGRTLEGEVLSPGSYRKSRGGASEAQRRAVAGQLGLDVYSSNPAVQDFVDAMAESRTAGRIGVIPTLDNARYLSPGGFAEAQVRSRIKNLSRQELKEDNARRLADMGVAADLTEAFLTHPWYSPTHQSAMVAYLEALSGVKDRGVLLKAALSADSEARALSYVVLARLLARYHLRDGGLTGLLSLDDQVLATTRSNTVVLALPLDVVFWNEGLAELLVRLNGSHELSGSILLTPGLATPVAKEGAARFGFSTRERYLGT